MLGRRAPGIFIANVSVLIFGRIDDALFLGGTNADFAFQLCKGIPHALSANVAEAMQLALLEFGSAVAFAHVVAQARRTPARRIADIKCVGIVRSDFVRIIIGLRGRSRRFNRIENPYHAGPAVAQLQFQILEGTPFAVFASEQNAVEQVGGAVVLVGTCILGIRDIGNLPFTELTDVHSIVVDS